MSWYRQVKGVALASGLALPIAMTNPAYAEATSGAGNDAETRVAIPEIVVTATKQRTMLSDTPMSISVLGGDEIDQRGIRDFNDIATAVPGVSLQTFGAGAVQVNMRGISTGTGVSPTVGIYLDDVAYTGTSVGLASGFDPMAFDFERIEVLRGPQGTLYGASTLNGLIKFVTVAPDLDDLSGTASVDLSTTRHGGTNGTLRGVVNAPIVSGKIAVRAGGFYSHDAGYIENIAGSGKANEADIYGGRIDVLLKPSDPLTIRIGAFLQNIKRDGHADVDYDLATGEPVFGELLQNRLTPEPFNQYYRLVNGTVDYDFGGATLTSITSYQSSTTKQFQDSSGYFVPLLGAFGLDFPKYYAKTDLRSKTFTEELRLTSASDSKLEWLVGLYYTNTRNRQRQWVQPLNADDSAVAGFDLLTVYVPSKFSEIAAFGNLTYHFTPKFDLTVGARIARDHSSGRQEGSGLLVGSTPKVSSKQTISTFLVNPRYQFNDDVMAYVRVASGYRPGGPNTVSYDPATGDPLAPPSYRTDKLWSYDVGLKASTPDNRFSIDANVFYIDWTDIQIVATINGIGVIANASKAKSTGVEVSANARPVRGLDINANFAFTDATLQADSAFLGGVNGERLPDTARFTTAVNADYSFPISDGASATLGAGFRYVGDRYSSFNNSATAPQYHIPSYSITDLRAGIDLDRVHIGLYLKNLFDNRGQISGYSTFASVGAPVQVPIIQPRTFGIKVRGSF